MQEAPTSEVPVLTSAPQSGHEALKSGLDSKASALTAVAQTKENLGHVAAGPVVTAGGEVLTPHDRESELAYRQIHGHPSN